MPSKGVVMLVLLDEIEAALRGARLHTHPFRRIDSDVEYQEFVGWVISNDTHERLLALVEQARNEAPDPRVVTTLKGEE